MTFRVETAATGDDTSVVFSLSGKILLRPEPHIGVTVEMSTGLIRHLQLLLDVDDVDDQWLLSDSLGALDVTMQTVVSSYLGLRIMLVDHGHPVRLTTFRSDADRHDIAASLELPLAALLPADPVSTIIFYAGAAGAFVDLAADLTHALGLPSPTAPDADQDQVLEGQDRPILDRIALDYPAAPGTLTAGVSGLREQAMINQAVGAMIEDGYSLGQAHDELQSEAAARHLDLPVYAATVLHRAR